MSHYLPEILTWLLFLTLIGGVNFPLARRIFPRFLDGGWLFAKILALLLVSYFSWLLGIINFLPFSRPSLIFLFLALFLVNVYLHRRFQQPWFPSNRRRLIFLEEVIFVLGFLFWTAIRSHNPSVHDLEKYMDFGFINSILRSEYFPPKDIWLSGSSINYYYFGHLVTAVIIKTLNTRPEVGYNLMLITLFAITLTASFSLGINLTAAEKSRRRLVTLTTGALSALILTLFGNLQVVFAFFKGFGNYWYPDATRFIPDTIHEFPIYSFVVADLHGHLLDIPFVLLILALLFSLVLAFANNGEKTQKRSKNEDARTDFQPPLDRNGRRGWAILTGLVLGVMYMTNAADSVIYTGLVLLVLFASPFLVFGFRPVYEKRRKCFIYFLSMTGLVLISLLTFSLPFHLTFKPFAEGINLVPTRSPLWMFLTIWGAFLFFTVSFLAHYRRLFRPRTLSDSFVSLLAVFAVVLILVPEIIYFKDIYTTQPRANTMFKFGYQAFILFSLVSAYALTNLGTVIYRQISLKGLLWLFVAGNTVGLIALYPYFAITSAYGKELFNNRGSLDGLKYLAESRPADYQGIGWINQNIKGQPVILEAVGESYTDYARVSANTGLPTVLGWPVHEWLWRKGVQVTDERRPIVETIYTSNDGQLVRSLLKKYQVEYIYLGQLEREKYPNLNETGLLSLGPTVYGNEEVRIIKVNTF